MPPYYLFSPPSFCCRYLTVEWKGKRRGLGMVLHTCSIGSLSKVQRKRTIFFYLLPCMGGDICGMRVSLLEKGSEKSHLTVEKKGWGKNWLGFPFFVGIEMERFPHSFWKEGRKRRRCETYEISPTPLSPSPAG